ncbi:MAG: Gfo/Idh/MocA family oxidoreductase [Planctomycetota bacterium]|nr:MAG: Gfo/Idh/MocA family oxidoreductase [Planctomycetota bacterium]
MKNKKVEKTDKVSRRNFIKASAAVGIAATLSGRERLFAAGSDKLRVGVVGCGWRGTGAAQDCVTAADNVEVVAMGDLFQDQLDWSLATLSREVDEKVSVTKETSFVGFDAYKKVIACDIDMVILATAPHFRPEQLKAAIEAGKHVFMEKPVAVDPVGIRLVIASSELAEQKGLAIVTGTQRRHQNHYLEIIKRIHAGDIGEIRSAQCYWNMGALWVERAKENLQKKETLGWSDLEWQCRNWLFLTWLSGDHIVEQHVHNLDIVNWAIGAHPVQAMGMGGREVRTGPEYGNVFDHFAVEYEYPNGVRVLSMCRQTDGCHETVAERIVGTEGKSYTDGSTGSIEGRKPYKYEGESPNPYVQEHADLIASIREGRPLNEGKRIAESTMTAIMGRMSAYTGRALKWDWAMNASKLDLSPPEYSFDIEVPVRPVAVPGKTQLI